MSRMPPPPSSSGDSTAATPRRQASKRISLIPEPSTPRPLRSPTKLPMPASVQRQMDGGGGGLMRPGGLMRGLSYTSASSTGQDAVGSDSGVGDVPDDSDRGAGKKEAGDVGEGRDMPPPAVPASRRGVTGLVGSGQRRIERPSGAAAQTQGQRAKEGEKSGVGAGRLRAPGQRAGLTTGKTAAVIQAPSTLASTRALRVQNEGSSAARPQRGRVTSEEGKAGSDSMPPPASGTGLGRSQSLRKPAAGVARSAAARSHGRTVSTSSARTVSTSTQSVASSGRGSKTPTEPKEETSRPAIPTRHRTAASVSGLARSASVKVASQRDTAVTHSNDNSTTAGLVASNMNPKLRAPALKPPQSRPEFSTFQQHFSPKKTSAPKPASSTIIHPPPQPVLAAPPAPEVGKPQSELLHLHLLHSAAAPTTRTWSDSAKVKLHAKFEDVAASHRSLMASENATLTEVNLLALHRWTSGSASFGLAENIQILASILHELPSFTDADSRYEVVVAQFDAWIQDVERIRQSRSSSNSNPSKRIISTSTALRFIEPLPQGWRSEVATLSRKLSSLVREAERMIQPTEGSSLAMLVDTCRALVSDMAEELGVIIAVERGVVEAEREWVDRALDGDGLGNAGFDTDTFVDGEIEVSEVWLRE